MNWFRRKKETAVPGTVQLRSGERHPFGMLADYVPLQNGELQLYRAVREAVPVVDAAIYKLIRMTGGVRATCQDAAAQRQLQTFLRTVPTGRGQQGINAFLDCYLDSLLVCGRAIGEIVPARGGRDIAALLCGRTDCIDIREGSQPLEFCICGPDETGRMVPLPFQNLLLFTPFHPEAEHPVRNRKTCLRKYRWIPK